LPPLKKGLPAATPSPLGLIPEGWPGLRQATAQEGAAYGNPFAAQAYPQKLTRLRRANNLIYRTAAR